MVWTSLWPLWAGYNVSAWIFLAVVIDLLVGDPLWTYHPVRLIGGGFVFIQAWLSRRAWKRTTLRVVGALITILSGLVVLALVTGILFVTHQVSVWLFRMAVVVLTYLGLAIRGVALAALMVYRPLVSHQWEDARTILAVVANRDTQKLSGTDMVRATVETVAENTCDAIVGPLFFTFLAGPAGLWLYKAMTTMDAVWSSQAGEITELGWLVGFVDRVLNWIPTRLTGTAIALASMADGRFRQTLGAMRAARGRFGLHRGVSEAAMAGALGVSLGGPQSYDGMVAIRPTVGLAENPPNPSMIVHAVAVTLRATLVVAIGLGVISMMVGGRWL